MSIYKLPFELPIATHCNASIGRVAPLFLYKGLPTHWQQSTEGRCNP
jgi:hypothetical protein